MATATAGFDPSSTSSNLTHPVPAAAATYTSATPLIASPSSSSSSHDPAHEARRRNAVFLSFLFLLSILFLLSSNDPWDGSGRHGGGAGDDRRSELYPSSIMRHHRLSHHAEEQGSADQHGVAAIKWERIRTHGDLDNELGGVGDQRQTHWAASTSTISLSSASLLSPSSSSSAVFSSWSESSVYVERTNSIHPSRPSTFGPHLIEGPLAGLLFPISTFTAADAYGCPSAASSLSFTAYDETSGDASTDLPTPPKNWIALVQRGHCSFSAKVRFAQENGAIGLLFGDQSFADGGIGGKGGLLTPWSPDDTSDIVIPSAFISRASYLSLLKTYSDEQHLSSSPPSPPSDWSQDPPIALVSATQQPKGLVIILSQEEIFTWPLLDFLLLLLFLPSLLTLLTVFFHRFRLLRQQKLERAPREAVAQLRAFVWDDACAAGGLLGEGVVEKIDVVVAAPDEGAAAAAGERDEERTIGFGRDAAPATESTALLPSLLSTATPSLYHRVLPAVLLAWLPSGGRASSDELAPRRMHRFVPNEECSICLSTWENGDRVIELPCGHLFHEEEIRAWLLESKRLCPVCRASITVDDSKPAAPIRAPTPVPVSSPIAAAAAPTSIPLVATIITEGQQQPVASSSSIRLDSPLRR